jgi:hypothetical protein
VEVVEVAEIFLVPLCIKRLVLNAARAVKCLSVRLEIVRSIAVIASRVRTLIPAPDAPIAVISLNLISAPVAII